MYLLCRLISLSTNYKSNVSKNQKFCRWSYTFGHDCKIKTISKKRYYETKLEESKSDLRQIWNTIRSALPTNRKNVTATSLCLLKINDCSVSAPHDITNYLNDFFSTIGSKMADRIDNSSKRDHFKSNEWRKTQSTSI